MWRFTCQDIGSWKLVFALIYVSLALGILFSSLFVFSSIYDSHKSLSWLSSSSSSSFDANGDNSNVLRPREWLADSLSAPKLPDLLSQGWKIPSKEETMPPLTSFKLTGDLVAKSVKNNVVFVTFGNYAFMDFVMNWVRHLTDLGLFNLLVGALDAKLLESLYWKGIPVFDMGSHMNENDLGWGTTAFHKMGREKILLIDTLLQYGYEIMMSDTDVVWMKNPLPYVARYPDADILTSTDQLSPTVVDDSLDIWQEAYSAYNIGIFHWRPTKNSKNFMEKWKKNLLEDDKIWDQGGFNDIIREKLGPSVRGSNGLVFAFDGNLKLGLLPSSIFCSGHTFFVQDMAEKFKLHAYAVHTTFQYGGSDGKRHRLREKKLFYDPPEYYDPPGGFLSFKPSIPKSLLLDGPTNLESHFNLVNFQIKQIRTALAVATILRRTLVMPPLWCRYDRLHYPHPGILPATLTGKPFLCPLDHVFEVNVMVQNLSVSEFGEKIDFREYSILENTALPKHVKDSKLYVQLSEVGLQHPIASNNLSSSGILKFPMNSSKETFEEVFSAFKDVKVIEFSSMQDAFQGFTEKEVAAKFRNRVKRYTGLWCCVQNHIPGHIYYDMYWDEKPNWQPKPPKGKEDDHPAWVDE